jgi:hypothetical protein
MHHVQCLVRRHSNDSRQIFHRKKRLAVVDRGNTHG